MQVLDRINNYKLDSLTREHLICTLNDYKTYLILLNTLNPMQKRAFVKTIKEAEIVNNHEMEHGDPFIMQLNMNEELISGKSRTSIDILSSMIIKGKSLSTRSLEQLHRLIIKDTDDDVERNYFVRDFDTYVYEINDGVEKISYVPPSPEQIRPYLRKLLIYINNLKNLDETDVLYKPMLEHFYIAALQPFGNGNTRLARLIEHGQIFRLTREILGVNISDPVIFLSKNHFLTKKKYRDSIADMVTTPNDNNWNKWIDYNLYMVDEQLYFCNNILSKKY